MLKVNSEMGEIYHKTYLNQLMLIKLQIGF